PRCDPGLAHCGAGGHRTARPGADPHARRRVRRQRGTVRRPRREVRRGSRGGLDRCPPRCGHACDRIRPLPRDGRRHPHRAGRSLTLGGGCAVGVAPLAALAEKYGEDLAVVWIDAHPDADTPATGYDGFHAMAAATLIGQGDPEIIDRLPATVPPSRFAHAGLHAGEPDALANLPLWGLSAFGPEQLRRTLAALTQWVASTGARRVAIHLDVDTVDSDEITFGLGEVPGGLTSAQ